MYLEIVKVHQKKPQAKIIVIMDIRNALDFKGKELGILSALRHFIEAPHI